MTRILLKQLYELLLFGLAIAALLWPAIDNGFPLLYSDSGTYIQSGADNSVPVDRPIIYSLFVKYVSMFYSLWFVIVAQAAIVFFAIHAFIRCFLKAPSVPITASLVILLSFTTGLSNYTSQIMPDIFSAWVILAYSLWVIEGKARWWSIAALILFSFLAITHLSNLVIIIILAGATLLLVLFGQLRKERALHVLILALTPFACILLVNHSYTGKYQISKASNAPIIARLVETGAVEDYLEDHCPSEHLSLCPYKGDLPDKAYVFLWHESPLYKGGCKDKGWGHCWIKKDEEFGRINRAIYTSPEYLKTVLPVLTKDLFKQLITFDIGILVPLRENSSVHGPIVDGFDEEVAEDYKSAEQYDHELKFRTMSKIQFWAVLLSLPIVLLPIILPKLFLLSPKQRWVIGLILIGIIANALVVDVFSNVVDRYQARIIWLIPLMGYTLIVRYWGLDQKTSKAPPLFSNKGPGRSPFL